MNFKQLLFRYRLTLISSACFWVITEIGCKIMIKLNLTKPKNTYDINDIIFLIGHPMWHFAVSYSFYNLVILIHYIRLIIYAKTDYQIKSRKTILSINKKISYD